MDDQDAAARRRVTDSSSKLEDKVRVVDPFRVAEIQRAITTPEQECNLGQSDSSGAFARLARLGIAQSEYVGDGTALGSPSAC